MKDQVNNLGLELHISGYIKSIVSSCLVILFLWSQRNPINTEFWIYLSLVLLIVLPGEYFAFQFRKKINRVDLYTDFLYFVRAITLLSTMIMMKTLSANYSREEFWIKLITSIIYGLWSMYIESGIKQYLFEEEIKDLPPYEQERKLDELKTFFGIRFFK